MGRESRFEPTRRRVGVMLTPQEHTSGVKTPCGVLAYDAGDKSPAYLSKHSGRFVAQMPGLKPMLRQLTTLV